MSTDALITADEAEEIVQVRTGPFGTLRTPLLILLSIGIVIVLTLLILLIMSLRGSRVGLEAAIPFLDKRAVERLQEPGR